MNEARRWFQVAVSALGSIVVGACGGGGGGTTPDAAPADAAANQLQCDVAIVGGGPGGVHTAYKLTTMHLTQGKVCLFEKSDHLGGRVGNNVKVGYSGAPFLNDGVPVVDSGQTGTGGYRMYNSQYTYALGQELAALGAPGQLSFIAQNSFSRLDGIANPGTNASYTNPTYFTYNNGDLATGFQPVYNSPMVDGDMWTTLLCGPQVPVDADGYPQYRQMNIPGLDQMSTMDYLQWVASNEISPQYGPDVAKYFVDVYRFRADFDSPNDAVGYLEFNAKDFEGGPVYYPVPSFQPYFDIMEQQILANGGLIFKNETVEQVDSDGAGGYTLQTSVHDAVSANQVVLAVPVTALRHITGDIIDRISSAPEYDAVQDVNAVTVTHQFGDGLTPDSGWWHRDITYPDNGNLLGPQLTGTDDPLRRTTNNIMIPGDLLPGCQDPSCDFTTTMFTNNTNELPLTDYHDFINISRSVYNDGQTQVANWIALYQAGEALSPGGGGNTAVNRQILKSLRVMYPNVFTGVPAEEPSILATHFTVHTPAWFYLKQGATANQLTDDSVYQWSLHPLDNEKVYLVSDSWKTDTSGWSDAAYKGSVQVLDTYFGASIDPLEPPSIKCNGGQIEY